MCIWCRWLLRPNCSVVTPNKQLGAGPQRVYSSVMEACQKTGNQFFYEVTRSPSPVAMDDSLSKLPVPEIGEGKVLQRGSSVLVSIYFFEQRVI